MQLQFGQKSQIIRASDVIVPDYMKVRLSTGVQWFDEACGSPEKPGCIPGSVFIISAPPGGGKSTLMRQVCSMTPLKALYNVGEECFEQVVLSLEERTFGKDFDLSNFSDVDELIEIIRDGSYQLVVSDSIQNLYSRTDLQDNELKASPGSNKQVHVCSEKLASLAKDMGSSMPLIFLICHSTKAGDFKGPQSLAHVIDGDILIEVNAGMSRRALIFKKNRFGQTGIEYVLLMTEHGLSVDTNVELENTSNAAYKRKSKGPTKQDVAMGIIEANPGISRDQFVEEMLGAGCLQSTSVSYWHALKHLVKSL